MKHFHINIQSLHIMSLPYSSNSTYFNETNGFGCSFCREKDKSWRNHCLKNINGQIICREAITFYIKNRISKHFSTNSQTFIYQNKR